jgi:hypothetical protein
VEAASRRFSLQTSGETPPPLCRSPNFLFAPLGGDPLHALFTY